MTSPSITIILELSFRFPVDAFNCTNIILYLISEISIWPFLNICSSDFTYLFSLILNSSAPWLLLAFLRIYLPVAIALARFFFLFCFHVFLVCLEVSSSTNSLTSWSFWILVSWSVVIILTFPYLTFHIRFHTVNFLSFK